MKTKSYQLEALNCPSCIIKIKFAMKRLKGVSKAEVSLKESKVKVIYDEEVIKDTDIKKGLEDLGYTIIGE